MRTFITLISLLFFSLNSFSQAIIGKMYTIVPDFIKVYGVQNDSLIRSFSYRASANTKFTVTGYDKHNNIKITFWRYRPYTKSDSIRYNIKKTNITNFVSNKNDTIPSYRTSVTRKHAYTFDTTKVYIDRWANYIEFAIEPSVFSSSCVPYYGTKDEFTWGVMTLPIKARFGNGKDRYFNYEEKLNLGFVSGWRHQLQGKIEQSINVLAGFGVANVRTDSLSLKSRKATEGSSSGAFSINVGVLYQYDSFQIGIFSGLDYITNALGRDWTYQGKPWIGLAVGISLYSRNNTQGGTTENKSSGKD